jgi:hypothetical protein
VHHGLICGAASGAPFAGGIREERAAEPLLGCGVRGARRRASGEGTGQAGQYYAAVPAQLIVRAYGGGVKLAGPMTRPEAEVALFLH